MSFPLGSHPCLPATVLVGSYAQDISLGLPLPLDVQVVAKTFTVGPLSRHFEHSSLCVVLVEGHCTLSIGLLTGSLVRREPPEKVPAAVTVSVL
jgi:hypothetical protein